MPSIGSLRAFVLAAGTALIGGYLSLAPFVPDFITCGILDGARNVAEGRGLVTNYITPAFLPYYQDLTRPLAYLWYPLLPVVTGALFVVFGEHDWLVLVLPVATYLLGGVLLDFANYGQWNDFCPSVKGEPVVGAALEMQVDLGNGLQRQVEYVTRVEPCHTITWSMENKPGDPVHADRTQRVIPIDERSCRYQSIDEFSGEFVPQMMALMAAAVERGFNRCAQGLKARAEALYRQA